RADQPARIGALAVVLVGLGLLSHAWLRLCRYAATHRGSLPLVQAAALWWSAPLMLAPPLFSRDGWSYAAQGAMAALGISPYHFGPAALGGDLMQAVDPMWRHTLTPYGPLPLWWGRIIAHITQTPFGLVVGYRLLAIVGLVLLAWGVPRLAAWTGADGGLATALVVASPVVLTCGVAGMHNDLVVAGLTAAALVIAREHWRLAAVVIGLAAAVKVPGGLVAVAVALVSLPVEATTSQRLRRLVEVGLISLATLVGVGWVSGLGSGWIHALNVPGGLTTVLSIPTMLGRGLDLTMAALHIALPARAFTVILRDLGSAGILICAAYAAFRLPTGRPAAAVRAAAFVALTSALLGPSVHLWYLLWALPFVGALPLRRRLMSGFVALSLIFALTAPMDTSWHGIYVAVIGGGVLIGVLLAAILLTRDGRRSLVRISAPAYERDYDLAG
ncbi:MAG: polyprenol phosphomannose-dependent alpha 1,6 mannosyltransferase MptB, partial [Marmoricola sp.]